MFDIFQYIQPFNFPITPLICLYNSSIVLAKFVTYYSQYYANIIGSALLFEAGGAVGTISHDQKYISYLFVAAPLKL